MNFEEFCEHVVDGEMKLPGYSHPGSNYPGCRCSCGRRSWMRHLVLWYPDFCIVQRRIKVTDAHPMRNHILDFVGYHLLCSGENGGYVSPFRLSTYRDEYIQKVCGE